MTSKLMWAVLVGVLGAVICAGNVMARQATTTAQAPSGAELGRLAMAGPSAVSVVRETFAPGASTGWQSSPGPSVVLVVSGTVTNYSDNDPRCMPQTYGKGSSFVDPGGGEVHLVRNETSRLAQTVTVQVLPKGAPRRTAASPHCHG
jgi:quercetin dioxygenase-like cupin family protein